MLPLLLACAVAAAEPPPGPPPPAAAPAPTIDSLLQSGSDQTTDTDEEPASPPPSGPTPYGQLNGKAYDDALRGGAAEGRAMAGTLDGGWTLSGADGQRLYRFQFVGHGGLEQADGAWRDLNGGPRLAGSGVIDQVAYAGDRLLLRFYEAAAGGQVEVAVKPSGAGPWPGELRRGGTATAVVFKRD